MKISDLGNYLLNTCFRTHFSALRLRLSSGKHFMFKFFPMFQRQGVTIGINNNTYIQTDELINFQFS